MRETANVSGLATTERVAWSRHCISMTSITCTSNWVKHVQMKFQTLDSFDLISFITFFPF